MNDYSHLTKEAVTELYHWQYSYTGCFSNMVFDLMGKADQENLNKLSIGFPEYHAAYMSWYSSTDCGKKLFETFGIRI